MLSKTLRYFLLALTLCLTASAQSGYNSAQTSTFTSATTAAPLLQNTRIGWHQLSWIGSPLPTSCSVQIDSSPDGTTWTAGGVMTSQACTTNNTSAVVNVNANYIRVNVTALSNGTTLTVFYTGWASNPTGGSLGGCTSNGSGNLSCGSLVAGPNNPSPNDVVANNAIATQPADSLNLFGDPGCLWESNWTPGQTVGMLCWNTTTGDLTWNPADSGQLTVKTGSHNCAPHTWFGNNTGNTVSDQDCSTLGVQDLTFGVSISGSANTYTTCPNPAITSLSNNGLWLIVLNGSNSISNTGASTLNVCGLGAKAIVKNSTTGGLVALASGDMKWNVACPCDSFVLYYDVADTEWVLTNPLSNIPAATPTTTWVNTYGGAPMTTANSFTANQHNLSCFQVPVQITTSAVTYNVTTADNSANLYDMGIADVNGNIIAHIGATAGTTFAPGTGKQTLNWISSVTLLANTNYWLDFTCVTCTAKVGGAVTGACFNANTGTTSGGALTNFTPPGSYQTGWNVVNAVPNVLLH